jgi:hypothetical protein
MKPPTDDTLIPHIIGACLTALVLCTKLYMRATKEAAIHQAPPAPNAQVITSDLVTLRGEVPGEADVRTLP